MRIPFMNLRDGLEDIYGEIIEKLHSLINNTQFIGGEEVESFEKEFAEYCHSGYAVGCYNGTDALIIALKVLGIGKDDTVLVPVNTFIATAEAVTATGACVDFIDVNEKTFNIDTRLLKEYCERNPLKRIKAVIPVHLYGQMANMVEICKIAGQFGLKVIEDSSQAHGATLNGKSPGQFGEIATFSFYPGKNLGAFGDAGAIITNNEAAYRECKMLVNHGRWKEKYKHTIEGYNKRLDTIQAAVLRIKLKNLPAWIERRRNRAGLYFSYLQNIEGIDLPELFTDTKHAWHLFVIRVKNRDTVKTRLKDLEPAYEYKGYKPGDFPIAEKLSKEILSLPFWPEITDEQIEYVYNTLQSIILDRKTVL